jgi:CRP-like cAMP-binding protein
MKKILIIEDNQLVREKVIKTLELAGYEVLVAENGKIGIEKARNENPDLVICSIIMPELDGYAVLRILNKNPNTSSIPFIFFTVKSEMSDLRKGMNLGADDYIIKPLEESDLLEAIETRLKISNDLNSKVKKNKDHFIKSNIKVSEGIQELIDLPKERKEKKFIKKEEIYREDDYANYLYYVTSGKVKCEKIDSYGKSFITKIYSKGDFFGYNSLLQGDYYRSSAVAMNNSCLSIIPKNVFLDLLEKNKKVSAKFIKMLSLSSLDNEKRLLQLAYSPVVERVSSELINITTNRDQKNSEIKCVDISREDFASIIGTAKESLIRELSELRKAGVIKIKGPKIFILNLDRLKATSKDFYNIAVKS